MQVRHGWSGEYAPNTWGKVDVYLDETDLLRILAENNIGLRPEQAPLVVTFKLLDAEAQRLLLAILVNRYRYSVEDGKRQMAQMVEQRDLQLYHLRRILDEDTGHE